MSADILIREIDRSGRYEVWWGGEKIIPSCANTMLAAATYLSQHGITGRLRAHRDGVKGWQIEGLIAVLAAEALRKNSRQR